MKIIISLLTGIFLTSVVFLTLVIPSTTPAPLVITQKSDNVVLLGNAKPSEVLSGKTFYNNSYTKQVGTLTLEGDALAEDVLFGKKFYNNTFLLQTGLYVPEVISLTGNVAQGDVLAGKTFYSNSTVKRTGTLAFTGDTDPGDVVAGKTFYSDSTTKQTGTLALRGDADVGDVMSGKTFYSDSLTEKTGTWSFLGDATVNDVVLGKTFYSGSNVLQTGSAVIPVAVDFSLQQYEEYDDFEGPEGNGEATNDYTGEESLWTNTDTDVYLDERTGLYWSDSQGQFSNVFPGQNHSTCPFFSSVPRGDYDGSEGACGYAINTCATLVLDSDNDAVNETDWYLPSMKEINQALINGIWNQTSVAFMGWGTYWSSTESSYDPTSAWATRMSTFSGTMIDSKSNTANDVRCVRRD